MGSRLFQIALVLCGASVFVPGAQGAPDAPGAQVIPSTLRLRLGQTPPRYVVVARSAIECRMPVVVPDLTKSDRMPVARIDAAPYAIRQAPVGCVNPLGPQPDTTARRRATTP